MSQLVKIKLGLHQNRHLLSPEGKDHLLSEMHNLVMQETHRVGVSRRSCRRSMSGRNSVRAQTAPRVAPPYQQVSFGDASNVPPYGFNDCDS